MNPDTQLQATNDLTDLNSDIDPEIANVLDRISEGMTLNQALKHSKINLSPRAWYYRLSKDKSLLEQYTTSRDLQAETLLDKLLEITQSVDAESANAARVAADNLKWLIGKLNPRKYSDKAVDLGAAVQIIPVINVYPSSSIDREPVVICQSDAKPAIDR
jgi:hypothetical protein